MAEDRRIDVDDEDAFAFACNAVRLGNTLITSHASPALRRRLEAWNLNVVVTPLTEFIKAGGAAKCLTLLLDQDVPPKLADRPRRHRRSSRRRWKWRATCSTRVF